LLQFIRSKTHPKNIFFINAKSLQDKIDLGALLSHYSRVDKDAETLYKKEFLTTKHRGNKFYAKVFGHYGDDSISELVPHGFAVCLEGIPVLWSTYLLHYRTLSAIEKSTRYVKASSYYKPLKFKTNSEYNDKCKKQLDKHNIEYQKVLQNLSEKYDTNDIQKPAILRKIKTRALDESRHLLPLSIVTSLGIMANLRSWLNILTKEKIRNTPSIYVEDLIDPLIDLFKEKFPTIFSIDKLTYLQKSEDIIFASKLEHESLYDVESLTMPKVNEIEDFEIVYTHDTTVKYDYIPYVQQIDRINKIKPIREYEMIDYTITIPKLDIATFRDIQRHRYFTIIINKWDSRYDEDCECDLLSSPMSTAIDITIKGNLRQWTHAIELRTQEQGHFSYRKIFQRCGELIADRSSIDKEILFPYADWRDDSELGLGRLKAESKKKEDKG